MNNGIIPGTNICHFVAIDGTNNPATTIATNDNNINIINEKSPFLIKSNNNDVNTSPIFENLNIATNSAAQNVININSPILLTGLVNTLTKSFSVFICLVVTPYTTPHTNAANDTINNIPLTNGEFAPNSLLT